MKIMNAATALVAILCLTGNAWGAERCSASREARALQAAAVQQTLMVAAFTCNDVSLYNRFVTSYQKELQASDDALKAYFVRHGGIADYHAFKTRLANQSSMASIHDTERYCASADAAYDVALNGGGSLAEFLADQPLAREYARSACRDAANDEPVTPREHSAMAETPSRSFR